MKEKIGVSNMDWNIEQLGKVIEELDAIQARFYMDSIGNQVANILNEAQQKLRDIYLIETCTED